MSAGKPHIVRATALALAIGVNVLFLLLLSSHRPGTRPEPLAPSMIWIAALEPPRSSPRRSSPRRGTRDALPAAVAGLAPPLVAVSAGPPQSEAGQGAAIDVSPIDWDAAAASAIEKGIRDTELQKHRPSLDSEPQVLVLPQSSKRMTGRTERFEGGVVITWINEDCAVKMDPQAPPPWALDAVGKFFGNHRPTCMARSAWERRSEELADALEAGVKPGYLGGTRPLPQEPATGH